MHKSFSLFLFVCLSSSFVSGFQSKVKVRRASISEPSDTDYEPQFIPAKQSEFLHVRPNGFAHLYSKKKKH